MKAIFTLFLIACGTMLTAQNYQSAESAEYDPTQNRWLIANGNNLLQRSAEGELTFFGSGAGSHGTEVVGDKVFVCNAGDEILGYDLATEEQVMSLTVPGATFLNGLTNDGANFLYAADFSAKKIFRIDISDLANPGAEIMVENTGVTPNGIIYDGENNRLLFVTWGGSASIRAVDLTDNSLTTVQTTSLTNIDGIDDDAENYYISSWSPARITKFDKSFANAAETVTTPFLNNPADIGFSMQTDTLAIPMGGNVIYVNLAPPVSSIFTVLTGDFNLQISPNPVVENSIIYFELPETQQATAAIYDAEGRKVKTLVQGIQPVGKHSVVLTGMNLPAGMYVCRLVTKTGEQSLKFIKN